MNKLEWKNQPLGNICYINKGKLTEQSDFKKEGWLPLINTMSLEKKSGIWAKPDNAILCDRDDVLILWDGERSGLVTTSKSGVVGSTFARLKPTEKIDGKFLYYSLLNKFEWIQNRRTGTGVPHVPKDLNKILIIEFPKEISNQKRIVKILNTCDNVIEQTEAAISKYKAIKQGMLHDLFTRGLDINGNLCPTYKKVPELYKESELGVIPEEWEVKRLGDFLVNLESGVSVNSDDVSTSTHVAILKTSAVLGGYFYPNENKIVVSKDLERVKTNPKADSIIISRMNTPLLVGECGYVDKDYLLLFLPDRLWQMVFSNKESICVLWLNYLLNTEKYKKLIKDSATGTSNSMKNITKDVFYDLMLPMSTISEQNETVKRLKVIDNKIKSEETLLKKYQSIKQGLMSDLLTGKKSV